MLIPIGTGELAVTSFLTFVEFSVERLDAFLNIALLSIDDADEDVWLSWLNESEEWCGGIANEGL